MSIKTNDLAEKEKLLAQQAIDAAKQELTQAAESGDAAKIAEAQAKLYGTQLEAKANEIAQRLSAEQAAFDAEHADEQALAERGLRRLTGEEREFCQKLIECCRDKNPKQALTNANLVLPETTIERVFEDLRANHDLLRHLDLIYTGGAVKYIVNSNGYQRATWGQLCDEIVKEITAGFVVTQTNLYKLSAFIPVCKQALILGPVWIDRYVREILYDAYANGLSYGAINGDGKDSPIGMRRQVGAGVTVTDGVYPLKDAITVNDFSAETLGSLLGQIAVDPNGKSRVLREIVMIVNPADRYSKVDPALLYRRADGTYSYSTPWPLSVVDDPEVPVSEAVFGLGKRYAMLLGNNGGNEEGMIDYSDHYQFLDDNRVYLIKGFANGFPKDNNAFLRLDISGVKAVPTKVQLVDAPGAPSVIVSSAIPLTTSLLGKYVNELQSNVSVGAAAIAGTLKYVTGYTGFSGDPAEQSGNYLALHIVSDDGATITVEHVGGPLGPVTLDDDGLLVTRVINSADKLIVRATKNGVTATRTYTLSGLVLEASA